jgi:copper resistance protein D
VIWLLKDFDLLSVLLREATLALEALTLGGVAFLLFIALPMRIAPDTIRTLRNVAGWFALALVVAQILATATSSAILIGGSGFTFGEIAIADFFIKGLLLSASALAIFLLMRSSSRATLFACVPCALLVLMAAVSMSHAAARLDDRPILLLLTVLHHLGAAAWVGAMPFLLITLRREHNYPAAGSYVRRFSSMAIASVSMLVLGGVGMAVFYVGSWQGVYGTAYGIMMVAKIYLMLMMLGMGAGNFFLARQIEREPAPLLVRLRRFSEVEIGLGFTAILAAASLTSQPPAVDLTRDRLTGHEIAQRMHWVKPRLTSPPLANLRPVTSIDLAVQEALFSAGSNSDENDRAWSEYNHHWAGLIVLAVGLLALAARSPRFKWAQHWPLLFIGLAIFILLRADPENWPLGPRPFWASFAAPDVLQHRMFALLVVAFAIFEWAVQTGRFTSRAVSYVFPLLCAAAGALLLTHSHSLGNIKEEMLAELSHTPIALLGATAGWTRWLDLRLPEKRNAKIASYVWPVCLVLVGLVLLDYRES